HGHRVRAADRDLSRVPPRRSLWRGASRRRYGRSGLTWTDTQRSRAEGDQRPCPGLRPSTTIEPIAQGGTGMLKKMHTRRTAVELILFLVLAIGGGLLTWGSTFATNMVHDQLSAQKITFPPKGSDALSPKEFPGLQRYAGQAVDNGPKAKAYANQFIAAHLRDVAGGKTYSEVSAASRANPNDTKL